MSEFRLELYDSFAVKTIDDVSSLVAEDASGSFGILAGHTRFMTCMEFGLSRFRGAHGAWQYLAMPGGLLYFCDNVLRIHTRRYVLDADYERVIAVLENELMAEERQLQSMKHSVEQLERAMLKRIWDTGRPDL